MVASGTTSGTDAVRRGVTKAASPTEYYLDVLQNCYDGAWFWESFQRFFRSFI